MMMHDATHPLSFRLPSMPQSMPPHSEIVPNNRICENCPTCHEHHAKVLLQFQQYNISSFSLYLINSFIRHSFFVHPFIKWVALNITHMATYILV